MLQRRPVLAGNLIWAEELRPVQNPLPPAAHLCRPTLPVKQQHTQSILVASAQLLPHHPGWLAELSPAGISSAWRSSPLCLEVEHERVMLEGVWRVVAHKLGAKQWPPQHLAP